MTFLALSDMSLPGITRSPLATAVLYNDCLSSVWIFGSSPPSPLLTRFPFLHLLPGNVPNSWGPHCLLPIGAQTSPQIPHVAVLATMVRLTPLRCFVHLTQTTEGPGLHVNFSRKSSLFHPAGDSQDS